MRGTTLAYLFIRSNPPATGNDRQTTQPNLRSVAQLPGETHDSSLLACTTRQVSSKGYSATFFPLIAFCLYLYVAHINMWCDCFTL